MAIFKASTQYADWKGSTSSDKSDAMTLKGLWEQRGLLPAAEFLVGAKLWVGENHNNRVGRITVSAYLFANGGQFETVKQAIAAADDLELKRVDLELTLEEFFALFKRFELTLSDPSFGLEGRQFTEI